MVSFICSSLLIVASLTLAASSSRAQSMKYPVSHSLGLISDRYKPSNAQVLKKQVEGRHCLRSKPLRAPLIGYYNEAVADAIAKVPGANVLLNVTFSIDGVYWKVLPSEICRVVVGDAAVLK